MRVHLDTDFGGDPDDACALAMLLGWPDVEILGITTTADRHGWRAAYVRHCLCLAGRDDIPVAAGARASLTSERVADPVVGDHRHWPPTLTPRPSSPGAALDLIERSAGAGATIIAIGPFTNLGLLEISRPGALRDIALVMMGGYVFPPGRGLPRWGPEMDFNVQWDPRAAEIVFAAAANLTLVTLPATLTAHLRAAHLSRLRASGPLGELLARQSAAHADDHAMRELGRAHEGLPEDLLNFHYDPVACAVALVGGGARAAPMRLNLTRREETLHFRPDPDGRLTRVVDEIDGEGFSETWLAIVEAAQQAASGRAD
jgi:inosine-uridine nucleoside N-ribohydrolase